MTCEKFPKGAQQIIPETEKKDNLSLHKHHEEVFLIVHIPQVNLSAPYVSKVIRVINILIVFLQSVLKFASGTYYLTAELCEWN